MLESIALQQEAISMANLLVVDDNFEAARPLAMLLRFVKHTVDTAASGDEALAHMATKLPDLVILDVMMPGMDGMEVLRRIRSDPRMCVVPVVMFSAVGDPTYRAAALRKGADDYIVKGSAFEELRQRVEYLARTRHMAPSPGVDCAAAGESLPPIH